jgi:anti-sigma factor RsiW
MNADDPQLTAYALDELPEPQRSAVARAVAESPELQRIVEETRRLAASLRTEFHRDLAAADPKPLNILPLPHERTFWPDSTWGPLAVAALLAMAAVVAAVLLSGTRDKSPRVAQRDTTIVMEVDIPPAFYTSSDFVSADAAPVSRFPLVVNTASWAAVQQLLEAGVRPPPNVVHVEALVNAFTYGYEQPEAEKAFAIDLEAASCPWAPEHQLVRVGIQARAGEEEIVAANAQVEVRFDRAAVTEYRLLGYQTRAAAEERTTSEDIRSGHQITALYEVVPVSSPASDAPLVTVELRYRIPARLQLASERQALQEVPSTAPSADFRFAVAVAEFALALRGEPGAALHRAVSEAAAAAQQRPDRLEFVQLARGAEQLPF